jgi:UrcA family protein
LCARLRNISPEPMPPGIHDGRRWEMDIQTRGSQFTRRFQLAMLVAMGAMGATAALTSNAPIVSSMGDPRTVKIEYGDLNLASQRGRDVLTQRIRQAVGIVCTEPDQQALAMWSEFHKCMQNAADSAWSQVRWPEN